MGRALIRDITPGPGQGGIGPAPADFDPLESRAWNAIVAACPRGCLLPVDRIALGLAAKHLVLYRQCERELGRHRVRSVELERMRESTRAWLREFFITDLNQVRGLF